MHQSTPAPIETQPDDSVILHQALREACLELMADYGLKAQLQPDERGEPPTPGLMAAIDFGGRDLRGTVALRASQSVITATYQAAMHVDQPPDAAQFTDWTCELVNQLIGRMKNKLRGYELSFVVNVPRVLPGLPPAELDNAVRSHFVCDCGPFAGYMDVLIAPGFHLKTTDHNEPLPDEGDLVLF